MATQTTVVSESAGQMSNVKMPRLPLGELGFKYIPAVPVDAGGVGDTLVKLAVRLKQREQPLQGLSRTFTIGGSTARAYNFLFGTEAADEKQAAAHQSLRGSLSRDPSEIVRILVGALKQLPEEPSAGRSARRRRSHGSGARRSQTMVDVLDHAARGVYFGAAAAGRVGGNGGRDAARQGDRGLLSDDRPLRPGLQPHSPQESAGPRGGNVADALR